MDKKTEKEFHKLVRARNFERLRKKQAEEGTLDRNSTDVGWERQRRLRKMENVKISNELEKKINIFNDEKAGTKGDGETLKDGNILRLAGSKLNSLEPMAVLLPNLIYGNFFFF